MPSDSHKITKENVSLLRQAVEKFVDRRIKTPADFDFLAGAVRERSRLSVSSTTLKRIWGYINDTGESYLPGRYSLCVLARFLGFRDYEEFMDCGCGSGAQSPAYMGETVDAISLCPDTLVRLTWLPDRECRLKALGNGRFEVLESLNSKLLKGDVVECASLTQNAPICFNRVVRENDREFTYVAGSRTGIRYELF